MRTDSPVTPVDRLIRALGLEKRATAEIQDMYSRPLPPVVVAPPRPLVELAAA